MTRIIFVLLLCITMCVSNEIDDLIGDSSQCKTTCSDSFPLHTYEKPSNLEACDRGCRLFSICEFAEDDDNFNITLLQCSNACNEAYNDSSEHQLESCIIGCKAAVDPAKERKARLEKEEPHIHFAWENSSDFSPEFIFSSLVVDPVLNHPLLMYADNSMQQTMNYMSQLFQMDSLMSFLMGDQGTNEKIIIIEINTPHPLEKQVDPNTDGNKIHSKTTLDEVESNLQTNLYGNEMINMRYREKGNGDYWIDYYDDFDHYENPNLSDHLQDWWDCFTKKAGLPELTLLFFWISTMILLVMCASMQFPSKKDTKLSISGDLAYIKETKGRIPDFLRVYGHPDIVQFTEVKSYKPDEKVPLCSSI